MKFSPHVNIGPDYMHRWHIIPRNRFFNIYLHHMLKDDDDRALHCHPWHSMSILLAGRLREVLTGGRVRYPRRFIPLFRAATTAHRLEVPPRGAWTLFITGPRIREWGFHCPHGWVHWRDFVDNRDTGRIGKGCGEE